MAIIGKIAKIAYRMTPARKAALKKAVAASAKKRAKKVGSKKVAKTVAKRSKVKAAGRIVKRTVKAGARGTKKVSKKILRTKKGKLAAITAGAAGISQATKGKANSKRNKSAIIARANQVSSLVKNIGVKSVTDTYSVAKNVGKAAIGKQSKIEALGNIGKDVVKSNLRVTGGLAKGQLNVSRAKRNKRKR